MSESTILESLLREALSDIKEHGQCLARVEENLTELNGRANRTAEGLGTLEERVDSVEALRDKAIGFGMAVGGLCGVLGGGIGAVVVRLLG